MKHLLLSLATFFTVVAASASEWPSWRGPHQNGYSPETNLIDSWTLGGAGQAWRADFTGRSTPVVFDKRVCAIGRAQDGDRHITKREVVACFDAQTGRTLWKTDIPVFLTTVPYTRAGWANVAADSETGYVFVHGVGGYFGAFDRQGRPVWHRSLTEEYSRFSGYGGRTHTPVVDGNLVILSFGVVGGWGSLTPPRHRYFAFDKRTGELVWLSQPAGPPIDLNTYGTPIVHEIDGRRLLIHGNGDGYIYALEVQTGRMVWKFGFSKRGINTAVVAHGDVIYATHGEENRDQASMGRTVAFRGRGQGDITDSAEIWRSEAGSGYVSPLLHDGRMYVLTNSANLVALNAADGKTLWELSVGTVGKGSPVFADGRIYVPEVNGNFLIVEPGDTEARILSKTHIEMPEGRYAEIYGSPAVAYGRIFLATENGMFALGSPDRFTAGETPAADSARINLGGQPAQMLVVPAEIIIRPGEKVAYKVQAYDDKGRSIGRIDGVKWTAQGLDGTFEGDEFNTSDQGGFQAGMVTAEIGGIKAQARLRIMPAAPFSLDFEEYEPGPAPAPFIGARPRFKVEADGDGKVLAQEPFERSYNRGYFYLGPPTMRNYTVQADVKGTQIRRRVGDFGLINQRYFFHTQHGRYLRIFSWISETRVQERKPFDFQPERWYTMKMRVDISDGQAVIKGKIWPRDEEEPAEWSITAVDPLAIDQGSPGLFGDSRTTVYYDNVRVTANEDSAGESDRP